MNASSAPALRIFFLNLENFVDFEKESQNYLARLPLINCGLNVQYRDFSHQRTLKVKGRVAAEQEALDIVREFRPHLIVYSHTWRYGDLSPAFFAAARAEGAKIVSCIWDSYTIPPLSELRLFENSDCLLIADSLNAYLRWRTLSAMVGGPEVGLCIGMYHFPPEPDEPKRRDVTILGSLFGDRLDLAKSLRASLAKHDIVLHTVGGMYTEEQKELGYREEWLDWEQYGRVIRESKICINSQNDRGRLQIKGKIFEIIGRGTFCLTDGNIESPRMFPPDIFPLFTSHEDCAEIIVEHLRDEALRTSRERAMQAWGRQHFDAHRYYAALARHLVFNEGPMPQHAFLDREFETLMKERRSLSPALIDMVGAQIELMARDGSFPPAKAVGNA